jgi:hypothetical protein
VTVEPVFGEMDGLMEKSCHFSHTAEQGVQSMKSNGKPTFKKLVLLI